MEDLGSVESEESSVSEREDLIYAAGASDTNSISDANQVFDKMPNRSKDTPSVLGSSQQDSGCTTSAITQSSGHNLGVKMCTKYGCTSSADGHTDFCVVHGGRKRCAFLGCTKTVRSASGRSVFCTTHGSGRRCAFVGCTKSAEGRSSFCIAHGGGRRCSFHGCNRAARGKSQLCIRHGGGRICTILSCTKYARGGTEFCVAHGGGKRCTFVGCYKSARGSSQFCIEHGGGKRCQFTNCDKGAVGDTDFCRRHGHDRKGKSCRQQLPGEFEVNDAAAATASNSLAEDMDLLFQIVLTSEDVGKLKRLVIPIDHAQINFPDLNSYPEGLMLNFEDFNGKLWTFHCCYSNIDQSFVLGKGWSRYVRKHQLAAGDMVSFYRRIKEEGELKFFIHSSSRADPVSTSMSTSLNPGLLPPDQGPSPRCLSYLKPLDSNRQFTLTLTPTFPIVAEEAAMFDSSPVSMPKAALLFCALYPPDHEFEKHTLLQLWMADGFFAEEPMEKIAGEFFEDCLTKGYFHYSRTNVVTSNPMFKFIGDDSLTTMFTSKGRHIIKLEDGSNLNNISTEVSHMSIRCHSLRDATALRGFKKFEKLRTLIFLQGHKLSSTELPRDFFVSLRLLKVLDLSQTCLMELPSSVRNMKCLCYFDLSETPIKHLPESIGCLENLQTLKLRGCSDLFTLPKSTRKLVNLRHLEFDVLSQLDSMPQGMGALTSIRSLSAFVVGVEEECGIQQLKNLNNLSGCFCITQLQNVLSENEAAEACLSCKSDLTELELQWNASQDDNVVVNYGEILSSLQPNASLEVLCINGYGGVELPSWICDPSFYKLVSITLFKCEDCLLLPSLGQLPSLKYLNLVDFHNLKAIGHTFYWGLGTQSYHSFPKLEKLTIENMASLEEWTGTRESDFPCLLTLRVNNCPKLNIFSAPSFLDNLEISYCPMLASWTGDLSPAALKTFIIEGCPLMSARFLKNGGQHWHMVEHIQNLWIDHQDVPFDERSQKGKEGSFP